MWMRLEDKVVLLIGINEVSEAISKGLLDEGAKLVIGGKSQEIANRIVEHAKKNGRNAISLECDATNDDQIKAVVDEAISKYEKIDVLITNLWESKVTPFVDLTVNDFMDVLNKSLKAPFRCVRAVLPQMIQQKSGKIIHVTSLTGYAGSTYGKMGGKIPEVPLSTAASALLGFMRSVCREVGPRNITTNAVCIPIINTESFAAMYGEKAIRKSKALTSLGKVCTPEDVVGPVIFLASEESNYMSGESIIVGGGSYMQ